MSEKDIRPPQWGPIPDPGPWGPDHVPGQPWDPTPWYVRHRFPVGDPMWMSKFADLIKPETQVKLQQLEIDAARVQLVAQVEFMKTQALAELDLKQSQLNILAGFVQQKKTG